MGNGKGKAKAKKLQVSESAPMFYEISQEQKKPEFIEKYKKRAAQEWKNGEMKRFHGMSRARGWGQRSVTFQAKLTAIAVNLKRIAALISAQTPLKTNYLHIVVNYIHAIENTAKYPFLHEDVSV